MTASSTTPLPSDIQQVLEEIEHADRAGKWLVATLSDEQFYWQPNGGRSWSVAQCLEHLATINVVYGDALRSGVEKAQRNGWTRSGPLAPGFFGRRFIASMEPPVKRRMWAPAKTRPGSSLTRAEILRRYHDAHARITQMIREAATLDANRATFANPFIKFVRVKVATGFHVIAAHDRRHLWQAEQVIARPDFPSMRKGGTNGSNEKEGV